MSYLYNRAELRDAVRRELGQTPSIDLNSFGTVGDAPAASQGLRTVNLNYALDLALSELNLKCSLGGDSALAYPVAAQTAVGPLVVPFSSLGPLQSVNDINSARWGETNGLYMPLKSTIRGNVDRDYPIYLNTSPSTPFMYWTEYNNLYVMNAPVNAGTLYLNIGKALWSDAVEVDAEKPEIIPFEFQEILILLTALKIARQFANNVEMTARAQNFMGILYPNRGGSGRIQELADFITLRGNPQSILKRNDVRGGTRGRI